MTITATPRQRCPVLPPVTAPRLRTPSGPTAATPEGRRCPSCPAIQPPRVKCALEASAPQISAGSPNAVRSKYPPFLGFRPISTKITRPILLMYGMIQVSPAAIAAARRMIYPCAQTTTPLGGQGRMPRPCPNFLRSRCIHVKAHQALARTYLRPALHPRALRRSPRSTQGGRPPRVSARHPSPPTKAGPR